MTHIEQPRESATPRAYLHTTQAGSIAPLMQSAITGLLLGVAALVLALTNRWRNPVNWFLYTSVFGTVAMWGLIQARWFALTAVYRVERATGWDLDGDGAIGEPAEVTVEPQVVRVQITRVGDGGSVSMSRVDLPISAGQLADLARGLADGISFSEREWTGRGGTFTQSEFRNLRREMVRRGLLEPINARAPQQGYRLTEEGAALMSEVANGDNSPSASGEA